MANWVKVETRFPSHPKVLDIGPLGEALWLRGLCYAGEQLTDGFIPATFIKRMGDMKATAIAAKLVVAGLWEEAPDGYQIHDFLAWQRSRDQVDDIASKRAEAGRQGGKQRASNLLAKSQQIASKPDSKTLAHLKEEDTDTEQNQKENTPQPPKGERVRPIKPLDLTGFEEFYEIFPRHIGRDPAEKAWAKLSPDERTAAIAAIREQITWPTFTDVPPDKIPHPTTWLNQGRWKDEPDRPTNVQPIRPPTRPQLPPVMQPGSVPPDGGLAAWRSGNTGG